MKTINTLAVLILLFAGKTYCQKDIISEADKVSISNEIKGPEALNGIPDVKKLESGGVQLDSETDSLMLPSQETPSEYIDVNSPDSPHEEIPETIPEVQELSSIATESEPNSEITEAMTQLLEEESTLIDLAPDVSEIPESTSEDQQPLETIICLCDCGDDSDRPQKCEQSSSEIPILENQNTAPTQSINGTLESERETDDTKSETTETEAPSERETSTSASELVTSIRNEESTELNITESETEVAQETDISQATESNISPPDLTEPIATETETETAEETENSKTTVSNNSPQESTEPIVAVPETVAVQEIENSEATPSNSAPPQSTEPNDIATETVAVQEIENSEATPTNSLTQESTEPNGIATETVGVQEIENSEAISTNSLTQESPEPIGTEIESEISTTTESNNLPQKGCEIIENNKPTTATDDNAVTASESDVNTEITSNLSNEQVSSETEPSITNDPLEVASTTISPCTEVGDISSPTNCRQYLSCSGNATNLVSQEFQCPERSAFSPVLRRCTRDLSPCLDEEPVCLRTSSIPNPNGENSSYYWCVPSLLGGFHKYHIQCSQNEIFIPLLGRCWFEVPQLGLGLGLINREPSDRDIVRAEWKLLRRELKVKAKEEKLKRKMAEKAKARAEKLAAKQLKKQKDVARKVDSEDDDDEVDD